MNNVVTMIPHGQYVALVVDENKNMVLYPRPALLDAAHDIIEHLEEQGEHVTFYDLLEDIFQKEKLTLLGPAEEDCLVLVEYLQTNHRKDVMTEMGWAWWHEPPSPTCESVVHKLISGRSVTFSCLTEGIETTQVEPNSQSKPKSILSRFTGYQRKRKV